VKSLGGFPTVAADLFVLAELAVEQRLDIEQRLLGIAARGIDLDRHAQTRSEHHDAHYAFGIDALSAACNEDFTAELAGQLSKLGSRASMQAQFITDHDVDGWHKILFLINGNTASQRSACPIGVDYAS